MTARLNLLHRWQVWGWAVFEAKECSYSFGDWIRIPSQGIICAPFFFRVTFVFWIGHCYNLVVLLTGRAGYCSGLLPCFARISAIRCLYHWDAFWSTERRVVWLFPRRLSLFRKWNSTADTSFYISIYVYVWINDFKKEADLSSLRIECCCPLSPLLGSFVCTW